MLKLFGQLNSLLSPGDRWKRFGIEIAMFVSAVLEMAGIGVFVVAVKFFLQGKTSLVSAGLLLLVLVLLIGKNLFAYWIVSLQSDFVYQKQQKWCATLYDRYLHGDFAGIRRRGGADCALSLSRVNLLCERAFLPAMQLVADVMLCAVLLAALAVYLPYIALSGVLFFGAATIGVVWFFYRRNRRLGATAGTLDLEAGKLAAQSLDALETLRAFGGENFFSQRYAAYQEKLFPMRKKLYDFGQAPRLILESSALLYLFGLLCAMLLLKVPHPTILLDFAALIAVFSRLLPAFSRMHYATALLRQYEPLWNDFYRDFTAIPEEKIANKADGFEFSGSVEIRDLVFGYPDGQKIFDRFSLAVKPGECVGVTGRTGSGKSTLFSLLLGFYAPESGEIRVDGKPLNEVLTSFRRQIGFVPQHIPLFEDTLRYNLTFGEAVSDEDVYRALKLARIDDFVRSLPGALDHRIDPDGNNLSGGQRQRLAIARALCRRGVKLLLLDEATSALDAMTESEFAETLASLHGKVTILVISHRKAALQSCDRIIAING